MCCTSIDMSIWWSGLIAATKMAKIRHKLNINIFFELVRAGLFPKQGYELSVMASVNWNEIYCLAEEQSVVGLVSAGLDWFKIQDSRFKVPQQVVLQFVGSTLQLEQRNKTMNAFVAELIERLRKADIYAILVKGQGIAQCYEKPLWRLCGDVDLLLSEENYRKAKVILDNIADSMESETAKNVRRMHQEYQIGGWTVELHGTLHTNLSRRIDREVDNVQRDVFYGGKVRSAEFKRSNSSSTCEATKSSTGVQVFLPAPDEDVVFVFTHILQHLFLEGIGLRQICDWCRLLWTYRDKLNHGLLEQRIRKMGLMSEWKVLATLAVQYLGMPESAMPMFGSSVQEFKSKADRLMAFILEVGNFGHNREVEWSDAGKRHMALIRHKITDTIKLSWVFPFDAPKFLVNYVWVGLRGVFSQS